MPENGGQVMYFTSAPATPSMSPSATPASPSTPRSGAEFYHQHMEQNYWRRLKKGPSAPPADGAGLLNGTRYHGRTTPLKGHGAPPPDNKESEKLWATKAKVAGMSHTAVKDLLEHHSGPQRPCSASKYESLRFSVDTPYRPCLRTLPTSYKSHMEGAGLTIKSEPTTPTQKPIRKPGEAAPTGRTDSRILCIGEEEAEPPRAVYRATPEERWQQQTAAAEQLRQEFESARPKTAPIQSEARRYYHADTIGHNDVFHYRYSGGICPTEYKFMGTKERVAPYTPTKTSDPKEAYFDARKSYAYNRVRALCTNM